MGRERESSRGKSPISSFFVFGQSFFELLEGIGDVGFQDGVVANEGRGSFLVKKGRVCSSSLAKAQSLFVRSDKPNSGQDGVLMVLIQKVYHRGYILLFSRQSEINRTTQREGKNKSRRVVFRVSRSLSAVSPSTASTSKEKKTRREMFDIPLAQLTNLTLRQKAVLKRG